MWNFFEHFCSDELKVVRENSQNSEVDNPELEHNIYTFGRRLPVFVSLSNSVSPANSPPESPIGSPTAVTTAAEFDSHMLLPPSGNQLKPFVSNGSMAMYSPIAHSSKMNQYEPLSIRYNNLHFLGPSYVDRQQIAVY